MDECPTIHITGPSVVNPPPPPIAPLPIKPKQPKFRTPARNPAPRYTTGLAQRRPQPPPPKIVANREITREELIDFWIEKFSTLTTSAELINDIIQSLSTFFDFLSFSVISQSDLIDFSV
jgi:hypothetical protein